MSRMSFMLRVCVCYEWASRLRSERSDRMNEEARSDSEARTNKHNMRSLSHYFILFTVVLFVMSIGFNAMSFFHLNESAASQPLSSPKMVQILPHAADAAICPTCDVCPECAPAPKCPSCVLSNKDIAPKIFGESSKQFGDITVKTQTFGTEPYSLDLTTRSDTRQMK
jgi:hypothetical protein